LAIFQNMFVHNVDKFNLNRLFQHGEMADQLAKRLAAQTSDIQVEDENGAVKRTTMGQYYIDMEMKFLQEKNERVRLGF